MGKNFGSKKGWDLPNLDRPCKEANSLKLFPSKNPEICVIAAGGHYIKWSKQKIYSEKIPFTINGEKAFDFQRDFTIASWIKMVEKGDFLNIFNAETISFMLLEWIKPKEFFLGISDVFSTHEHRDVYSWQHVAVVYKYPRDIKYYYNGKDWPLRWAVKEDFKIYEPSNFKFWYADHEVHSFLALVQMSLSEGEINKLMKTLVL